ncbi:bifunctional chorismate synthase/riboflavin reductase [NAD(P)H] aro2 [Coemansia javaensis]|uniref:Chorismate synthase n=1 Tax=Coemansia javaensis TaxID=2761396 RepID=A0A9W8HKD8_9FUNG|nr:bifunctional chorismate synthase/riboflavin reductase [NAD(P)H] aro2 [Coemansia javaensis]
MSTFGTAFRVTTYGESHCKSVGCIIDGVPPGLALSEADIQTQLTRRRPGQSKLTTPRDEKDRVTIQSGCEFGHTLGTPICLTVQNQDQRPHDYSETDLYPRPSHADWTYLQKYGVKASSGGGRSSARETIGRVAAGAVAEKYLAEAHGIEIVAFVSSVGAIGMDAFDGDDAALQALLGRITRAEVDATPVRCPDAAASERMQAEILACSEAKNSTGGTVTCVVRNVPAGLGEPCFDKLEARLAHAMLSIPATKGFEVGSGFRGTQLRGSEHNDAFVRDGRGGLRTASNHSGGIQGGISNGEHIYFRVAFKPPATISQDQRTATYAGEDGTLAARGRHDPCVVPRAVPIVEAMAALVVMDALLVQNGRSATRALLKPVPAELKGIKPI